MGSNKQIKIGAVISYFSIFINILSGLIYTPWIKNQIGIEQYGLYTLSNSVISLLMVDFGLSSAVTRYLSKYRAEGEGEKASQFLGAVYKLYLLLDLIIFIILTIVYVLIDQIYIKLNPQELELFKGVYIISATFSLVNFPFITLNGILNSYEKFIQLKVMDVTYRILVVVSTVCTLILGGGLYALVFCNALSGSAIVILKYNVIRKSKLIRANFRRTEGGIYKEIFGFSIWVTISTLARRMVFNIVPSILGIVAGTKDIAVFGLVASLEGYVYLVTSAINGMFMPKISRIYAGTDKEKNIMPLMLRVGRFQFVLNSLLVVGFSLIGKEFIVLWMGEEFANAHLATLLILIPGMFFNAMQIANTAMVAQKKVKLQAGINVISGVTNLILSVILSLHFGVLGASISIAIANTLRVIAISVASHKVMNIKMPLFVRDCYLKMAPTIVLSLVVGGLICQNIILGGWSGLCLKGLCVVIVYGILFMATGLNYDERRRLGDYFKGRGR